jgi:hypothetical protein
MSGLKIAALYGLKPHQLGLCGSQETARNQILQKFLKGQALAQAVKKALKQFKGAYPYYRLIARANGIKNPFAEKVVRAYWIGNELLKNVKTDDLRAMITKDFAGAGLLSRIAARNKAASIPENAVPHHSFHVLFVGSVTGSVDFTGTKVKDICRVGWGRVEQHNGGLVVSSQPLSGKQKIRLGKPKKKKVARDHEILPVVNIGDWVSFHWGQAVEILSPDDVNNLKKYTSLILQLLSP